MRNTFVQYILICFLKKCAAAERAGGERRGDNKAGAASNSAGRKGYSSSLPPVMARLRTRASCALFTALMRRW